MTPYCDLCGRAKIQPGRYADYICECCDVSARCPHVSFLKRFARRMAGRRA
jgi:hypothetical protein